MEGLAQACHVLSVCWVLLLAGIIFFDVTGRFLFNTPFLGAPEIIKNSVVSITFLQLPLAIHRGDMIRTTLLYDALGMRGQRCLRLIAHALGLLFFLALGFSSWEPAFEAWGIGEYEGEGALRVPTYPVRFLVSLTGIFAATVYFSLILRDGCGRQEPVAKSPAPGQPL